ncbi:MAG: helix-turn-helix domain-containing protein [Gammaproteobacteria bacterium]|nr:helix-turn-helix domain-containing protein [Gammaproteobacteria bacterium]
METTNHETLDLREAADFLKLHWQTLRAKAQSGDIPAAKLGPRWVFLKADLVSHLRSHYSTSRPRSQVQQSVGDSLCCSNDPIRASGGVRSLHQTEIEYNSLLGR